MSLLSIGHELIVCSQLNYLSLVYDGYLIGVPNCRQPMGNFDTRFAFRGLLECLINKRLVGDYVVVSTL